MALNSFLSKKIALVSIILLIMSTGFAQTRITLSQSCGTASSTLSVSSYQNYSGNGADGALTVSSSTTINTVATAVTGNNAAGSTTINVSSTTGISAGDEILIISMQDNSTSGNVAGQYEFREVASVTSTSITMYAGITNTYNASTTIKHQVIRVPNYTTVNVSGTLTCPTWNGSTGGVLVFRASLGLTISSNKSITASGLGYRGTSHNCMYQNQYGTQGEGIYGTGSLSTSANQNGGGGGGYNCPSCNTWDCGGGGGGGYASTGTAGTYSASNTSGGTGGSNISNSGVTKAYMGGAGGEGGADEDGSYPGYGGNGGGIIMIGASSLTINSGSSIVSNGNVGGNGNSSACSGQGCGQGGGGGGAGGTIILQYGSLSTSGSYTVSASGASGGTGTCVNYGNGGSGSNGAIRVEYSGLTPTTTPTATTASLPTPTYSWSNSATTSTTNVSSNGSYSLTLTYGKIVDHTSITVSMSTPSVSISASTSTTICSGTSVTFTATPTNGGASPAYQWKKNGNNIGTSSATYTDNGLANNDLITCVLTSNASCITTATAASNSITMTVNANVTPSVSIGASTSNAICSGTTVIYTATPTNGGASPSYQWKKNGNNVGSSSTTYTDNGLTNNDAITCVLTSNATCLSTSTATSNSITMTVNANVTPAVSISASASTICSGTSVTFTAIPTNGGASPFYQWKKNGNNVGTSSTTYADNGLANNDVITCVLTSNATCVTSSTATSNSVTMIVNAYVTPSISIGLNTSNNICSGTSVTFTATPTNGGVSPSYQWKKNSNNVGTNNTTYTDNSLANNDIMTCVITSNATCLTITTAGSNSVTMSVTPTVTPSISIAANPGTSICSGTNVTFIATPVNGGSSPSYQWKKNGSNIGTSSTTYANSSLANNDAITCVLTSNVACATTTTATSSTSTMTVTANVTPSVTIVSSTANPICSGTSVTFTATPINGGAAPIYQWKDNGVNVGTSSNTYSNSSLANNDVISCVLTSNAACATTTTANSNSDTIAINPTHWTGAISNDWSNTGNWECGVIPVSGVDADIPSSCSQFPTIGSGTQTCRHLTIHQGCNLTISNGAKLNIEGTLDHNGNIYGPGYICFHGSSAQICKGNGYVDYCEHDNGNGTNINPRDSLHIKKCFKPTSGTFTTNDCLHFESDSTCTAQCLGGSYSNYISGNIICHNYIHGGRRAFRFMGHPYSSTIPLTQLTDYIDITGNGGGVNGFTGTNTNNPSAFWYDPTAGNGSSTNDPGWTAFTNTNGAGSNAWKPCEGALVMVRGAKGEGLCCGTYTPSPVTTRTHGPINEGNVQVSCTSNSNVGYNFISNPYPCNIDLSQCTRGSSIGANFSVWDPNQGTQGAYVDQPFSFSYILPAYSAFIVTTSASTNNTITFHETDKNSSAASGNLFKTTSGFGNDVVQLRIMSNHDSLSWDRLLLFFNGQALSNLDPLDGQKVYNPGLSFYSYSTDANQLSIDVRPFVSDQVIQLGIQNADTMDYSIRVDDLDVPGGATIYLHDKYLNQMLPLSKGIHYDFSVTADPASEGDNRFELNMSTTGIKNVNAENGFAVSMVPNPATDHAVISFTSPASGKTEIRVTNIMGQEVFYNDLGMMQNGKVNLPLNNFAGIYLVTVKCGDLSVSKRLVKQ